MQEMKHLNETVSCDNKQFSTRDITHKSNLSQKHSFVRLQCDSPHLYDFIYDIVYTKC